MREEEERILRKKKRKTADLLSPSPFKEIIIIRSILSLFPNLNASPFKPSSLSRFFLILHKNPTVSENLKLSRLSFIVPFNRMILRIRADSASFVQFKSFQQGRAGVFHHRSNNKGKNRDGWIYICLAAVHRRNIHGLRAISGFVRRGGSGGRGRWQREKREREKEEEKRKEGKKNRKIEE